MKTRNAGFTLIEILVALFIFAIISVIISYGLKTVLTAKQKISNIETRLNQLQFALILIQHDTSQLIDYTPTNGAASSTTGNNTEFTFTTTDNANPMGLEKRSNILHVSYTWTHHQLIRHIWLNESNSIINPFSDTHAIPQPTLKIFSRVLLSNISNFKFRYLTPTGFIDTWPPPNVFSQAPPLAVQINFTIPKWGSISQLYRIRGVTLATN